MLSVLLFFGTFLGTIFLSIRNSAIFLFVLYQAYYFFNPQTKWWSVYIPDFRFSFYIVLTILIVVAINWPKLAVNKISSIPQFWFLYIMVFLYGMASFYAVLPLEHEIAMDAILTAAVVISLVYKLVTKEEHLHYIVWGYIAFAAYLGYYIMQVGRVSSGRFGGGAGMVDSPDANGIGAAIAPALIFSLYYFWQKRTFVKKLPFVIAGFFLANALVLIGSRGAFLGVLVGASVFMWILFFSKMQRKNQKKSVIGILIFGLIGVVVVTDRVFWERMLTIAAERKIDLDTETGGTRTLFWKAAIDMSKDHPLGAGSSGFIYYSPQYLPQNIATGSSRNRAVHSTWFEVLSEIGYPGFIAFCGVVYYSFVTCRRASNRLKEARDADRYFFVIAIACAFLCFIVTMTFLNRLRAEVLYWCILYTAVAYNIYVLRAKDLAEVPHQDASQQRS